MKSKIAFLAFMLVGLNVFANCDVQGLGFRTIARQLNINHRLPDVSGAALMALFNQNVPVYYAPNGNRRGLLPYTESGSVGTSAHDLFMNGFSVAALDDVLDECIGHVSMTSTFHCARNQGSVFECTLSSQMNSDRRYENGRCTDSESVSFQYEAASCSIVGNRAFAPN